VDWWHENARPENPEQSWNLAGTFSCWVAKLGSGMLIIVFTPFKLEVPTIPGLILLYITNLKEGPWGD
jgi:hypothetical protein